MAKVDDIKSGPSLSENIESLKALLEQSGDYLELILEEIVLYDEAPRYREHPEEALVLLNGDLGGSLNDFSRMLKKEVSGLDEVEKLEIKRVISAIIKNLVEHRPVSLAYLSKTLLDYGNAPKERTSTTELRVANILLDYRGKSEFLRACRLVEDTEGGSGSHTKWSDPLNQLKGTHTISRNGNAWLRTEIKQLLGLSMPLQRLEAACSSCKYDYTLKIDNGEE